MGVTLSVPDGITRALRQSRLPDTAEGFVPDTGTWVPLEGHPAVVAVLSRAKAAPASRDEEARGPGASRWRDRLQAVQRWAAAL